MTKVRIDVDDQNRMATVWNDDESYEMYAIHPAHQCAGRPCVLHAPSNHHMRDWRLEWENGRFVRCGPGPTPYLTHPDPDTIQYMLDTGDKGGRYHECDGSCGQDQSDIQLNRARCALCGDIITSLYRHDFVSCGCGQSYVDGGFDYMRWGGAAVPVSRKEEE